MSDLTPFEKEIKQTYRLPEVNPAFIKQLEANLQARQPYPEASVRPAFRFARGWSFAMATLLVIAVTVLAIGPSKVLAQAQVIFGFVSGVGLVDTSSPFRQLAEPVSETRDGITLTVQSAFLSADGTTITYAMSDLPAEMKRAQFGDPECNMPAYLALPDGSKLEARGTSGWLETDGFFVYNIRFNEPFPANENQADLVFPCLVGAAQGRGPQDWQIALAFKAAPEDIVVYPAALAATQVENPALATAQPATQPKGETGAPAMPAMIVDGDRQEEMVLLGVVEKPEAYWVTWAFPNQIDAGIQSNGYLYVVPFNPVLYDANGTQLPEPADQETQNELWEYEGSLRDQL